jgi:hypothetical protein
VAAFVRTRLDNSLGGLTPLSVVRETPVPQLIAVYDRPARNVPAPEGRLKPGERVVSPAEFAAMVAQKRKEAARGPSTPTA